MNVFERIMAYNAGREPERLQMKLAAMKADPFTFLRGTCHLFYEDWCNELNALNSPTAWVCGDLHLENFGSYKADNGLVYFDLNDFDECALAPCLWELTRLLTSLILASGSLKLKEAQTNEMLNVTLSRYAKTLASGKPKWVERRTADGLIKTLLTDLSKRSQKDFVASRTKLRDGGVKLFIDGKRTLRLDKVQKEAALSMFKTCMQVSSKNDYFYPLDIARRAAGTGSLGVERYVVLVVGVGGKSNHRLVDIKANNKSALSPYLAIKQPQWKSESARVANIQSHAQAMSPALLKSVEYDEKSYLIKELQPTQDRINLSLWEGNLEKLAYMLETMADITAWCHLRNAGYMQAASRENLMKFALDEQWPIKTLNLAKLAVNQTIAQWLEYKQIVAKQPTKK